MLTLVVYAGQILVARRASRGHCNEETVGVWRKRLLAAYAVIGVTWALFAYQHCTTCQGDTFVFYKAAVLLIALAAMRHGGVRPDLAPITEWLLFGLAISWLTFVYYAVVVPNYSLEHTGQSLSD